jgi:hypothetical protein
MPNRTGIDWGKRLDARSRDPLYRLIAGELARIASNRPITASDAIAIAPSLVDQIRERVPGADQIPRDAPNERQRRALRREGVPAGLHPTPLPDSKTLTVAEVAARLGIDVQVVRKRARLRGVGHFVGSGNRGAWEFSERDIDALAEPGKRGRPPKTPLPDSE